MRLPLAVLVVSALVPAQERVRILGSASGRDGPWTGARVVLHSKATLPGLGEPDTIETRAGKNGRFRAHILPGRSYSAWARHADDAHRQTEIARHVVAGSLVRLQETSEKFFARLRLEAVGLDNWRGQVELRFIDDLDRVHPLELDEDGATMLGDVAGSGRIVVRRHGKVVYTHRVSFEVEVRRAAHELAGKKRSSATEPENHPRLPNLFRSPLPPVGTERLVLPPPLRVRCTVVDRKSKKPIPGARVTYGDSGPTWTSPVATTDATGRAELWVPTFTDSWGQRRKYYNLRFVAQAKGFSLKRGGFASSAWGGLQTLDSDAWTKDSVELELPMRPGFDLHGVVSGADERAELPLVLWLAATEPVGPNGWTSFHVVELAHTGKGGGFTFHGLCDRSARLRLGLILPAEILAELAPEKQRRLPQTSLLWIPLPQPEGQLLSQDVRAAPVDLAKIVRSEVAFRLPDGRPARGASVRVLPMGTHQLDSLDRLVPAVRTDRRGRCRILSFETNPTLVVQHDDHYLIQRLALASPADRPITLEPYATVRGRVVDAAGNAVPDGRVMIRSTSWSSGGGPFQNVIGDLNRRLLAGPTAADGSFKVRFIPEKGLSYGLAGSARIDGKHVYGEVGVQVALESIDEAELVLPVERQKGAVDRGPGKQPDRR